ncbi:MAG: PQQ-dependent sugar dehydrogenase [Desulfobulbaceae bacterium]|nr:PQQ-dependent sugar dehydrogenase [Desulfobulbaceae bacterium]
MSKTFCVSLILSVLLAQQCFADPLVVGRSEGMDFQVEEVVSGLGVPWGMAFLSPSELLFTEREGAITLLHLDSGRRTVLQGGPIVFREGQGGMLDVAVPKGYSSGNWIYFTYSKEKRGHGVTTLARARLSGDQLIDWQDLLVTKSATATSRHFGSRIAFDNQGHLFFTIGDRGERPNGQDLASHAGSILRLRLDGVVPEDNPFVLGQGLPEIWSYGHRNPQGVAYDSEHNQLWSNEHGPRGGDEINLIMSGKNYGWPVVSHGKEYWGPVQVGEGNTKVGMVDPVKVYIPSIAPGSLLLYSGKAFMQWQGNLFSGALVLRHLNRVVLSDSGQVVKEERLLADLEERIRAVVESPDGWLYLSTDSGRILRLRPKKHEN